MNYSFLLVNQNRRKDYPLWMLICFGMFCFWQMGVVYFMGPSLNIDGRTPMPIDMDNITMLIAFGYVFAIAVMCIVPKYVIWISRITTLVALCSAVGLFLPFNDSVLRLLIYTQAFCCCFMIGFETFTMVNYWHGSMPDAAVIRCCSDENISFQIPVANHHRSGSGGCSGAEQHG